jgi:tRNA pseudouridine55 synthase
MRALDPATGPAGASPELARDAAPAERHGLLAVDKPSGVTSHDVVARVRRALRTRAVGHLGTLDPPATGLLLVMVGAATRCAAIWQGGDKLYEAVLRFGVTTSTQDATGEVLARRAVELDEATIRAASRRFVGDLEQVPPMVSAVKVAGERLYRLARRGVTVERRPRAIHVASWEWLGFDLPLARFRVRCSAGTYVRTLAHDLGEALGAGAALESLRRLASGDFDLTRAVTWEALGRSDPETLWAQGGVDLAMALARHPGVTLGARDAEAIGFGAAVALDREALERAGEPPLGAGPRSIVILDPDGRPLALGELAADPERPGDFRLQPHVVLPWAVRSGPGAGARDGGVTR